MGLFFNFMPREKKKKKSSVTSAIVLESKVLYNFCSYRVWESKRRLVENLSPHCGWADILPGVNRTPEEKRGKKTELTSPSYPFPVFLLS